MSTRNKFSTKPDRNSPCPCGSGRKYKNCCGATLTKFQVVPRNQPEVINSHLVSPDDGKTWIKNPGNIAVRIGLKRVEDSDEKINSIITSVVKAADKLPNVRIREKLFDCRHKLYAVRYHLLALEAEIEQQINNYFQQNYSAGSGVAFEVENQKLVYETEAFLFQVKSSIDLLVQALGGVVPPLNSMHTFKSKNIDGVDHSGGAVIVALRKNGFQELGALFEQHRTDWIQELVLMRDTITHYSHLHDFHCFIEEPYLGKEQVTIHYPSMPTGVRVDLYCRNTYEKLINLYNSACLMFSKYANIQSAK